MHFEKTSQDRDVMIDAPSLIDEGQLNELSLIVKKTEKMTAEIVKIKNEIILYQPDNSIELEVMIENDTVWLTQAQMTVLFDTTKQNVSLHINNIFREQELERISVVKDFLTTANDGKNYLTQYYNLDVIISVGYRVKSKRGTQFRQWATNVLKDYFLKGYAISNRFERVEHRVANIEEKVDFLLNSSEFPKEGVFYNGQIFDAFVFVADLVKMAKKEIILIDNYLDESVLMLLAKRNKGVRTTIYTKAITPEIQLDLQRHNAQYPEIFIEEKQNIHDRFLLIDNDVYHIGASFKDLGKKLFAFSKMGKPAGELLKNI